MLVPHSAVGAKAKCDLFTALHVISLTQLFFKGLACTKCFISQEGVSFICHCYLYEVTNTSDGFPVQLMEK